MDTISIDFVQNAVGIATSGELRGPTAVDGDGETVVLSVTRLKGCLRVGHNQARDCHGVTQY